jgi:anti-anti-sigma regulatory factor
VVASCAAPIDPFIKSPGLRTDIERTDRAVIFHLVGRLDIPGSIQLWSQLRTAQLDRPVVILDLAAVPEIEPCALAVFATTQRRLRVKRLRFGLWGVRAQPLELITQRRLHRLVDVVTGPIDVWLDGATAASVAS